MGKYIISLDAGTTSNRCIVFNKDADMVSIAQKKLTTYYPQPAWVEQDPIELWSTQIGVCTEALARKNISAEDVEAIGITNQRETTIVWDKETGEPVYNAIVWQCRRTASIVEELDRKGYTETIRQKTGLIPDPYYSATKIRWILDEIEDGQQRAENGELLFGTVDSWILYRLTHGKVHKTDYSNASRTMLFNLHTLEWDEELCEMLNIPMNMLPEVQDSSSDFGVSDKSFLGAEIPITGMIGDQQSSLFGQTCFEKGEAKNTYGTGAFLLMNAGKKPVISDEGLVTTIAWGLNGEVTYALEGSVFVAGSAIQWLRDKIRIVDSAEDTDYMATRVDDTDGCYFVPALTGLGAPYWDPYARGTLVGMTFSTTKYHIIRATLESLAYLSYDVLTAMEKSIGTDLKALKVDGGASNNDFLMQFQSDMIRKKVIRPDFTESTALGAAFLAGLQVGFWKTKKELIDKYYIDAIYNPKMDMDERGTKIKNWHRAVERSLQWEKEETEDIE